MQDEKKPMVKGVFVLVDPYDWIQSGDFLALRGINFASLYRVDSPDITAKWTYPAGWSPGRWSKGLHTGWRDPLWNWPGPCMTTNRQSEKNNIKTACNILKSIHEGAVKSLKIPDQVFQNDRCMKCRLKTSRIQWETLGFWVNLVVATIGYNITL